MRVVMRQYEYRALIRRLGVFARAFEDPARYCDNQPDAIHLRKLLAGDPVIAVDEEHQRAGVTRALIAQLKQRRGDPRA